MEHLEICAVASVADHHSVDDVGRRPGNLLSELLAGWRRRIGMARHGRRTGHGRDCTEPQADAYSAPNQYTLRCAPTSMRSSIATGRGTPTLPSSHRLTAERLTPIALARSLWVR